MSTKIRGDAGEELACKFLLQKGYKILERNFHLPRAIETVYLLEKTK